MASIVDANTPSAVPPASLAHVARPHPAPPRPGALAAERALVMGSAKSAMVICREKLHGRAGVRVLCWDGALVVL